MRAARIDVRGLTATGYHGVFEHERRDGQTFVVDISLRLPEPSTDDVSDTVNYGSLSEEVVAIIEGPPVDLIETLAARIADHVLAHYRSVSRVKVTVHKPSAPIRVVFADVSVSVTRRK